MVEDTDRGMLTIRFEGALVYASRLHAQQTRKGNGVPYMAHLLGVTALVLEDGADEDEAIAALLHDAIEDQGGKAVREEIRNRFGERVAVLVEGCSDSETMPKPPWRERKEHFIESLRTAPVGTLRIVAADKLHNVRALLRAYRGSGKGIWESFHGGKAGTLWYYGQVTEVLEARMGGLLVEELREAVSRLGKLVRSERTQEEGT